MSTRSKPANPISRREALSRLAVILGGTIVGAEFLLNGTRLEGKVLAPDLTADQIAFIDEVAETILPATDTPGAKAAGVGAFIALVVKDCYDEAEEAAFRTGLGEIESGCRKEFGKGFMDATPAERTALLAKLDASNATNRKQGSAPTPFALIKQLAILSFFTSEIGCTQVLRFTESPGLYLGCTPYQQGDPAWFTTVGRVLPAVP